MIILMIGLLLHLQDNQALLQYIITVYYTRIS